MRDRLRRIGLRRTGTPAIAVALALAAFAPSPAAERIAFSDRLPYGRAPIDYAGPETDDPVARLNRRLDAGEVILEDRGPQGHLASLLEALKVPVESQSLVYSRTAQHPRLVGPKNPRVVYFNDAVSVAWVPGAPSLEVAAVDPRKGVVFYTLEQQSEGDVRLERQDRCLACHAGRSSLHVPGFLVRSFLTDERGKPLSGFSQVTHETPLADCFGGWYVTGKPGGPPHDGNLLGEADNRRHAKEPAFRGTVANLEPFFDGSLHLAPHSDIVAQLVWHHQAQGQNLLTRVGQEARLGVRSDAEERLLRYLLFVDERKLPAPVEGRSGYSQWFEKQGPFDQRGRSLRTFNLRERLFEHRLSYLIYGPSFEGLPAAVKSRLYARLGDVLSGRDESAESARIPAAERRTIVEIVQATKDDLPPGWPKRSAEEQGP